LRGRSELGVSLLSGDGTQRSTVARAIRTLKAEFNLEE